MKTTKKALLDKLLFRVGEGSHWQLGKEPFSRVYMDIQGHVGNSTIHAEEVRDIQWGTDLDGTNIS